MSDLTLIPSSSTDIEVALDQNSNRLLSIDSEIIKRVTIPAQTPIDFLTHLAWGRRVDFWYDDWPEHKKRAITEEIYRMHRLKGTLAGTQAYLKYIDAKVVEHYLPPQGIVARGQSKEALKAFRERFAQLRLYSFTQRGQRAGSVASITGSLSATVGKSSIARANVAPEHYGRRATIFDRDTETDIRSADQIKIGASGTSIDNTVFGVPADARASEAIAGRSIVGASVAHASMRGRLFVLGSEGIKSGAAIVSGGDSARVLNIEPDLVREQHPARYTEMIASASKRGSIVGRSVVSASRAGRYYYSRWYLYSADRMTAEPYRSVGPVVGRALVGLAPYRAHLRVDARFKNYGRKAVVGRTPAGKTVAGTPSDRFNRVGRAIWISKAERDDIRFTTQTHKPVQIGDLSFDREEQFSGMKSIIRRSA